jgi:predicted RNase H-like HicB family nuclease
MLTEYLAAAMRQARYEILPDDGSYYGEIPDCRGVYAQAATLEACRGDLAACLEDWLLFRLHRHLEIPVIDGLALVVREELAA